MLRKLKNGEFIIIHGMAGAGKSVLATQAVRDSDLLRDYFECNVHWLTIGRTDKDSLLTKMQVRIHLPAVFIYEYLPNVTCLGSV